MKTRHVFLMRDLESARMAVASLHTSGMPQEDISIVARADIEMERIPDDYRNASTDFIPAALRGTLGGGSAGLVAGLIGVAVPAIGITVAGVAALTLIGAATGGWATALAGSAVPDPIRRRYEQEIADGRILVVVDVDDDDPEDSVRIDRIVAEHGAEPLSFSEPSAMR